MTDGVFVTFGADISQFQAAVQQAAGAVDQFADKSKAAGEGGPGQNAHEQAQSVEELRQKMQALGDMVREVSAQVAAQNAQFSAAAQAVPQMSAAIQQSADAVNVSAERATIAAAANRDLAASGDQVRQAAAVTATETASAAARTTTSLASAAAAAGRASDSVRSLNEALASGGERGFGSFAPTVDQMTKRFGSFREAVEEVNKQIRAGNMDIGYANQLVPQMKVAYDEAASSAGKQATKIKESAEATEKLSFASVGARRELIVLAHEAVSGNISRMPGSMMVLAERMGGVSLALMGQVGALAAVAYVSGEVLAHHEKLNQALTQSEANLKATGAAAQISRAELKAYMEQLQDMNGIAREGAEQVVVAFSKMRGVTPSIMADMVRGMEGWVAVTGEEAPAAAAKLGNALSTPSKMLEEVDKNTGRVSAATLAMVAELERAGDIMGARTAAARAFGDAMEQAAKDSLTPFQLAAKEAANNLRLLGDAMTGTSHEGDVLASMMHSVASALEVMRTPAEELGKAFWGVIDIVKMLIETLEYLDEAARAIVGPVAASVANAISAMALAAKGDFAQAAEMLKRTPADIAREWETHTAAMQGHLKGVIDTARDIKAPWLSWSKPEEHAPAPAADKPQRQPEDESIKRAMHLAEQYRSDEMRRADLQGKINELKRGEEALVSRIAQDEKDAGGDQAKLDRLKAERAELERIRQARGEAERQKAEIGDKGGAETALQGLQAQLDRRRDMERHSAEEWHVIERDFWAKALTTAQQGTKDYDQILRRKTQAQKAVDDDIYRTNLADLERQRQAAENGSAERIAIARREADLVKAQMGERSKDYQDALRKIGEMEREAAEQTKRIEREKAEAKRQFARDSLALQAEELAIQQQTGQISALEQIAQLRKLKDQEYALEKKALNDRKALYRQGTVEYQRAMNDLAKLDQKRALDLKKLDAQQLAEHKRVISEWTAPMKGAMSTMVSGVLQGTMTMQQLFGRALEGIATKYAEKGLEIAMDWAENQLAMALSTESSAAQQTAAVTEETTTAIMESQIAAAGSISADAARAAAAAYASICAIPIVGPALAPAAAAEAYASTEAWLGAVAVAERGWGEVPEDNAPALLHKKEMVLPADIADPLRGLMRSMPSYGLPLEMTRNNGIWKMPEPSSEAPARATTMPWPITTPWRCGWRGNAGPAPSSTSPSRSRGTSTPATGSSG
ncbi:phage tail length tape measure family protein [Paramagnetospirillum magneticum]|uniref:Phage-related minor tail protein n=1 Tax=Paramagnetospirillum magneticum (strain ATCC 700264 / AMB-1) TaxID=342108 RepID=Q2W6I0_PARM1|nr:phage tail length tape measure family protein [Paramagnetospirillum magneticum]BAE50545.1 Phage-related minor tail protein [Paramagnetospirillum magneticum AMB-1]